MTIYGRKPQHLYLILLIANIIMFCAGMSHASAADTDKNYVEGEVIAVIRAGADLPGSGASRSRSAAKTADVASFSTAANGEKAVLISSSTETAQELIDRLKGQKNVISVAKNYKRSLMTTASAPNDARFGEQWGLPRIGADKVWTKTTGSRDVVVAVLDTGIIYDHEDLTANLWTSGDICGRMFANGVAADINTSGTTDGASPFELGHVGDINGHGTHVAGVIGAVGNNGVGIAGVNWQIKILPVGVFSYPDTGNTEPEAADSDIIAGLDYVMELKRQGVNIKAVNMSFGGWSEPLSDDSPLGYAIKQLSDAGVIVCTAAGNDYEDLDNPTGSHTGMLLYPACFKFANSLTVGAATKENKKLASSNYSSQGKTIDLFAPGDDIISCCRRTSLPNYGESFQIFNAAGYDSRGGTSLAAPYITGSAALLCALNPDLPAKEIKQLLIDNADDLLKNGYSKYGFLNLYKASGGDEQKPDDNGNGGCNGGLAPAALAQGAIGLLICFKAKAKRK